MRRAEPEPTFPATDPLAALRPTPSMRATLKYFWVVAILIVVQILFGAIVAGVVVCEIVAVVWTSSLGTEVDKVFAPRPADYSNTAELGRQLYTEYVYPFELAAVLLLIAIVAAISLTMRKRAGLKQQDVARQVAVRREDRVRIIKMDAERPAAPAPASPEKGA